VRCHPPPPLGPLSLNPGSLQAKRLSSGRKRHSSLIDGSFPLLSKCFLFFPSSLVLSRFPFSHSAEWRDFSDKTKHVCSDLAFSLPFFSLGFFSVSPHFPVEHELPTQAVMLPRGDYLGGCRLRTICPPWVLPPLHDHPAGACPRAKRPEKESRIFPASSPDSAFFLIPRYAVLASDSLWKGFLFPSLESPERHLLCLISPLPVSFLSTLLLCISGRRDVLGLQIRFFLHRGRRLPLYFAALPPIAFEMTSLRTTS